MRPRRIALLAGLVVLGLAWLGPLPQQASSVFTAHMAMHVAVVALAAPLLALGLAGSRLDPARCWPRLLAPLPVSMLELLVIWAWHAPALHHLSRHDGRAMALEQALFLVCSLAVWLSAIGGGPRLRRARTLPGVGGLLLTSMHMTLLGALLALGTRPLYGHAAATPWGWSALQDQHYGGLLMLLGAGSSYLIGALLLMAALLRRRGAVA